MNIVKIQTSNINMAAMQNFNMETITAFKAVSLNFVV